MNKKGCSYTEKFLLIVFSLLVGVFIKPILFKGEATANIYEFMFAFVLVSVGVLLIWSALIGSIRWIRRSILFTATYNKNID